MKIAVNTIYKWGCRPGNRPINLSSPFIAAMIAVPAALPGHPCHRFFDRPFSWSRDTINGKDQKCIAILAPLPD